jgi:L-aminopeptidase/D-esterase-like protein
LNASTAEVPQGCVGAGTGATAGNILGAKQSTKSGIGSASINLGGGLIVGALIAVNPFGDVINDKGEIIAGTRSISKGPLTIGSKGVFADTMSLMKSTLGKTALTFASSHNTVIGVVATNAKLDNQEVNFLAQMAQDGLPMAVRPSHTLFDGDTLFALSTGNIIVDVNVIGAFAAKAVKLAIQNAVKNAVSLGGLPAMSDFAV